jgi:hypothetical protein
LELIDLGLKRLYLRIRDGLSSNWDRPECNHRNRRRRQPRRAQARTTQSNKHVSPQLTQRNLLVLNYYDSRAGTQDVNVAFQIHLLRKSLLAVADRSGG